MAVFALAERLPTSATLTGDHLVATWKPQGDPWVTIFSAFFNYKICFNTIEIETKNFKPKRSTEGAGSEEL